MVQDGRALVSRVRHLAVAGALLEEHLRVGLLEEGGADLRRRDVAGNGEDLGAVAVGVVQALDEVSVARAAGRRAHRELAGGQGVGARGKRSGFLVAYVNPLDVGLTQRISNRVEGVADNTVNALHALLFQGLNELLRKSLCH